MAKQSNNLTTSRFGSSLGPSKPLGETSFDLKLQFATMKSSIGNGELEDFEFFQVYDLRLTNGGLMHMMDMIPLDVAYAGGNPKKILKLASYTPEGWSLMGVRLRPTQLDLFNQVGTYVWTTLAGVHAAITDNGSYAVQAEELFVYTLGSVGRLQMVDANGGFAQGDLSADAPKAQFVTRIGNRLFAASINDVGILDPYLCQWSADGNIQDWTTATAGAGRDIPPVEGSSDTSGYIRGLSTLVRGVVLYRQNGIQLASLTGIGAAPFRFAMLRFSVGTESPYSVASGRLIEGDFYLGLDYMVYLFTGDECIPIGDPVLEELKGALSTADLATVFGTIDVLEQEYVLAIPAGGLTYRFNIREYLTSHRLKWRIVKQLTTNQHSAAGYTVTKAANPQFGLTFGDTNGAVVYNSASAKLNDGYGISKMFHFNGHDVNLSRVRMRYRGAGSGSVKITVWNENRDTNSYIFATTTTDTFDQEMLGDLFLTGRSLQFRIEVTPPAVGSITVTELEFKIQDKGLTNG